MKGSKLHENKKKFIDIDEKLYKIKLYQEAIEYNKKRTLDSINADILNKQEEITALEKEKQELLNIRKEHKNSFISEFSKINIFNPLLIASRCNNGIKSSNLTKPPSNS